MIPRLLLFAFPDRIAKRREDDNSRYVLRQGRGVRLSAKILPGGSPYLIAVMVDKGEKAEGTVHMAEPLTEELIREALQDQIEAVRQVEWDKLEGRIVATLEECLEKIVLSARQVNPSNEEVVPFFARPSDQNRQDQLQPGSLAVSGPCAPDATNLSRRKLARPLR